MIVPLGVDLGQSFDSFQHGAQEFFHRLSEIGWVSMAVALFTFTISSITFSRSRSSATHGWARYARPASGAATSPSIR